MTNTTVQNFLRNRWAALTAIVAAAAVSFLPVLSAGYVQWDDALLTNKLELRGLGAEHLSRIFLPGGGAYQPVRDLYFALIYSFSGLEPFGYHFANWLLNLVVAVLAFFTARALVSRAGANSGNSGAVVPWLVGLVFAVHPLHTEVVAWMQGNKDLLAGAFFLGAFLCWDKFTRRKAGGAGWYLGSLGLFLLALGSKPSAVCFPLLALALDLILPAGRESGKSGLGVLPSLIPRYLPFLVPAAALTLFFVFGSGAMSTFRLNVENFLSLPLILAAYYRLILLPVGLNHRYLDPVFHSPADPAWLIGVLVSAGLIVLAWRERRRKPLVTFGIVWFFACWLPQSNLVPIAIRVADRYIFLSIFGLLLALAAAMVPLLQSRRALNVAVAAGLLLTICLGAMSWRRSQDWRDGVRLWSDAVERYPQESYYHYGLAEAYLAMDNLDSARTNFARAAELAPREAKNWTSLAYTLKLGGDLAQAEKYYRKALEIDSGNYYAANSLGNIYSQTGQDSLALEYYRRALEIRPGDYMVTVNLSTLYRQTGQSERADSLLGSLEKGSLPQPVVLLRRGREFISRGELDSARTRFLRAVELDNELMPAWAGLGEVYLRQDSTAKALEILRRVRKDSEPGWELLNNMALAFERLGQPDSATAYYLKAFEVQPDSVQSAVNLAVNLNRQGDTARAIDVLEQVLERQPDNFPALRNLGNWLAAEQRFAEAVESYSRALEINPNDANVHYNLGSIYLQYLGQPRQALHHLKECLRLDPDFPYAAQVRQVIAGLENNS